jgi:hypothetical protein
MLELGDSTGLDDRAFECAHRFDLATLQPYSVKT